MRYLPMILLILLIPNIYATCSEGQININIASLNELDELIGIGPVKAEAIIDTRPFDSVDDLIDVYGIGEITLKNIKDQGLACVNEIEKLACVNEIEKEDETPDTQNKESEDVALEELEKVVLPNKEIEEKPEPKVIELHPQIIKGKNDSESSIKINYPMYGFVLFCILLGFLFIIRQKRFNKNEFR